MILEESFINGEKKERNFAVENSPKKLFEENSKKIFFEKKISIFLFNLFLSEKWLSPTNQSDKFIKNSNKVR